VIEDLLAGMLAGLAVAMPIGAIGSYLVGLAAREQLAAAVAAALGVATVDGAYALVAALGGAGLQGLLEQVTGWLTVLAAVVLVAVAARTLQLAVRRHRSATPGVVSLRPRVGPVRAYLTLIAMTAINPATVITFAAVVLGRSGQAAPTGTAVALFAIGALAASATWQLLLVGGGSVLGRLLRGRGGQLGIALVSAGIMLGLAVAVLVR
jgi:arginine exporter protein ArgO